MPPPPPAKVENAGPGGVLGMEEYTPKAGEPLMVRACVAAGMTEEQIASVLNWPFGISIPTLKKHFHDELRLGRDYIQSRIVGNLVRKAIDPNGGREGMTAGIFLLKSRYGWRDSSPIVAGAQFETTGQPGAPTRFTLVIGERPDTAAE